MACSFLRKCFEVGQNRAEAIGIGQESVDVLPRVLDCKISTEPDMHLSFSRRERIRCKAYSLKNILVAGAPARIPCEGLPDLIIRRTLVLRKQSVRRHQETRRAITALQAVTFDERFLQRVHVAVVA